MSFGSTPYPRSNPAGEAKAREQKRQAELETSQRNSQIPAFMFRGFGFRPQYRVRGPLYMEGPLCPRLDQNDQYCFTVLKGEMNQLQVLCEVCNFSADLPQSYEQFREVAHKKYEGHLRFIESGGKIQTLDVPYEAIKAKLENDTRTIKIKWSQKDGRDMALIYFIDDGKEGKKSQIFVDMDREEIRYDASDVPPGNVLAKVTAEFPSTKAVLTYKDKVKE